jgi:hypothetical protein
MAFLALLSVCKATKTAIEYRGKLALLASFNMLADDESSWRDGVEPYLLDLYDQCANAVSQAEECERARPDPIAF